ncbi:membrane-associated PAP2 superfamily phosphatase [Nitrospirillum amazonense]|uniref:Membrane-associated PAP2 superfamily phosphatase n=1 Tax=Nitrospirillum amazonense TaxID=28077 RepID=A0A560F563_9PROT|nr:phosphatase PAP2 family protein [Nitrospirillum amazonense]TWB16684.1 membrane-associated PAP2 superfamily phosphatase [Nitrospirillum amazonense]
MPSPTLPRALSFMALIGLAALLAYATVSPTLDLAAAGWFWTPQGGFAWRANPVANLLHEAVQVGARVMAGTLVLGTAWTAWRRRPPRGATLLGADARAWGFLLLSLAIGPGLLGNAVLKDHWHRARPVQVVEFGGAAPYTPPVLPAPKANCGRNCSFVSGDAVLAFFLHSFAYTARRRQRLWLYGGLGVGAGVGLLRIGMGGHFFSDVMYAGLLAVLTSALLHAALYGRRATLALWCRWLPG